MKGIQLILLIYFITQSAFAQIISRDSLVGSWVCEEARLPKGTTVPAQHEGAIKKMQGVMISSRFELKADGLFRWEFPQNSAFSKEMEFLNGRPWLFNAERMTVDIGEPQENLMQFSVYQENKVTYFVMDDPPLLLRVVKRK